MKVYSSLANAAIEQVLELSAGAHIKRRMTSMDSESFQRLTGEIAAYGTILSVLVTLGQREEFYRAIAAIDLPASPTSVTNLMND